MTHSMSMERDPMKDDPSVIKVRGLPWEATAMDLCKFFRDCDIVGGPNGIHFCTNDRGQPSGEAFIEMERPEDVEKGLEKHKQNMGRRYVEVFESRLSVMEKVKKGGSDRERSPNGRFGRDRDSGGGSSSRGGGARGFGGGRRGEDVSEYCVKLRGIPWSATKDDVADFLDRVNILGGHRGIIITTDDRGRPSGDAYVEVETSDDVDLAMKMNRRDMGSRYVEVFEANPLDVERAKDQEEGGGRGGGGRDRGRRSGHTVQLRGLPFRASEREIADWLSEAADPDEVIIVMDRTGRPSGQADAIFRDERDARRVVSQMHKRDMGTRYIECFFDEDD